jgi:hypothetical protein
MTMGSLSEIRAKFENGLGNNDNACQTNSIISEEARREPVFETECL